MNRRKFIQLSREPRFLVISSINLVIMAMIASAFISTLASKKATKPNRAVLKIPHEHSIESLTSAIRSEKLPFDSGPPIDFREVDFPEPKQEVASNRYDELTSQIAQSTSITAEWKILLTCLLDSIHGDRATRSTAIKILENLPQGLRFRNEFLGDAYFAAQEHKKGIAAYIREGEQFAEAAYSHRSALIALTERKEVSALQKLLSTENFGGCLSPVEEIESAFITKNYLQVFLKAVESGLRPPPLFQLLIAAITAATWFLILATLGNFTFTQALLSFPAFLLGLISAIATLYAVMIQEHHQILSFHSGDSFLNQLLSVIAGIGLREETIKLAFFLPSLFVLLKYKNPLVILITAALTGLGFAALENLQYLKNSPDNFVAWSRLLTANVMHFCLTGILGFSLYQLIRRRGRGWDDFLFDFLLVVIAHGLYDGFIMIPILSDYEIVTTIILVLIAYRYLDLVRANLPMDRLHRKFSPLGIFVWGIVTLACAIMIFTSFSHPLHTALGSFAYALGGTGACAFAYISRLRDL